MQRKRHTTAKMAGMCRKRLIRYGFAMNYVGQYIIAQWVKRLIGDSV